MKVNQDSRTIKPGEWFVAVKGDSFDGHDFVSDAVANGAAEVLELEELFDLTKKKIREYGPQVIAVTGSYGKTTTKEVVYKVLSSKFKGARTRGNLNTPLGVALEVINGLKQHHQFFVAEVGMDRLGEIKKSCLMISPQIGVLTSVGEMHLEKLGTLENIKQAKSELLVGLPVDGTAVLNWDDGNIREISEKFLGKKIKYGFSSGVDASAGKINNLPILGDKNKQAAFAAYCVGKLFGLEDRDIFSVLRRFKPPKGRLNLTSARNGIKIIDDTYNAGPQSTLAALNVLEDLTGDRKIAILGDMLELGKLEKASHNAVLKEALKVCDLVVPVGDRMQRAAEELGQRRFSSFGDLSFKNDDVVLIKGSRGMKMERFVKRIKSKAAVSIV
ncbi:MAG TPA: UDP-N-acetylmuramoyl-tripeptide--D-alanyl-D-alanine ligase [candidate division WWE3 bacterium]|uniref:UDP-N-acetylmuramoyl-tripeptide--D-alanyl-D-alanine ligase n=1 Tax=candidate division WWE3 bacterium TaxID=2053526 RepID=A0A7C1SV65_UNCKA|nr:UDP-N-acetylmuramoyl-tripeptide--D-alanyl-D-alanine ligase [candidate division WWE3 bacterium]